MDKELNKRWDRKIEKESVSVYGQLYDYFHKKAKKYKAYERTAERFENDDFDVIVWNGAWWIEKQHFALPISRKVYDHIHIALAKEGIYYLF